MSSPNQPQYYRMLLGLRPPGAYDDDDSSLQAIILAGEAEGFGIALEMIEQLPTELSPVTTTECLEDWEELYNVAVPDGASDAERRETILGLHRGGKPCNIDGFSEQLEPILGTFEIQENLAADVTEEESIFFVFVFRDPTDPGTYDILAAQRLADRVKEAHLLILVGESEAFQSNDEYSRTNRDIVGA